jgi:hypothetical protein
MGSPSSRERWHNIMVCILSEFTPLASTFANVTTTYYYFDRFARLRLSLRFELMSLDLYSDSSEMGRDKQDERCPSVALKKIQKLSSLGSHEDLKHGGRHSMSTPDLPYYFGNMLGV